MTRGSFVACLGVLILTCAGCGGPLGPLSGGALSGDEAPLPAEWTFASEIEQVQLETRPADPYSVNTWIGVVGGNLYIPTSLILGEEDPGQRAWVQHVQSDPNVRLRIEEKVYALKAIRVEDEATINNVKTSLLAKYGEEPTEHSDRAWVYQLTTR